MRLRHKNPSLVSMWMLDVFCCALGCVTLLWLLKTREAGKSFEQTQEIRSELIDAELKLSLSGLRELELSTQIDDSANQLARMQEERDKLAKQLALMKEARDAAATRLALAEKSIDATTEEIQAAKQSLTDQAKSLQKLKSSATASEEELARKKQEVEKLSRQNLKTQTQISELEKLVREKDLARIDATRKLVDLNDQINSMAKKLDQTKKPIEELALAEAKISDLEKKIRDQQKKIDEANVSIIDLQGNKAKLADKLNRLQVESDQKFAGIAMTGKRVIFLVDMSGSMDLIDEKTQEPTKWPLVRETVIKVMRSLPNLEKFQIVLFSSRNMYLFEKSNDWIDYDKEKSIEQIDQAMRKIKPAGDTNMYLALEECFRYRDKGLDTLYLFSDGLPTSGPGLTAAQIQANLSETQKSDILSKHIRRTLNNNWNRAENNKQRVRINSIGFFYESPDVGAFLWALSRENEGSFVGMSKP